MKFQLIDGCMSEVVPTVQITQVSSNAFIFKTGIDAYIFDVHDLKNTLKYVGNNWFGEKSVLREGVFWAAFMTYIFPWFLDIAKVYCAIMVCKAFYEERRGGDGRSGFQALVYYGKWFIMFSLLPFLVDLISQVGNHMRMELMKGGVKIN